MLSEPLRQLLKRSFSYADWFCWFSFTFDKGRKVVISRKRRSVWLHRASFGAYLIYVFLQTYGILWHSRTSNHAEMLISSIFNFLYLGALLVTFYWEADPGIPQFLNVLIKPRIRQKGKKGKMNEWKIKGDFLNRFFLVAKISISSMLGTHVFRFLKPAFSIC